MTFPGSHADRVVCRLLTRGRVTGRLHDVEMWFGATSARIYLISGNGPGADWYRNAVSVGAAAVSWGDGAWGATAYDVVEPAERRSVGEVMRSKHGGWGGDPGIGLTEEAWTWTVPALGLVDFVPLGEVTPAAWLARRV